MSGLPGDLAEGVSGVGFFDLARFAAWARGRRDREVAALLQRFYEQAEAILDPAGLRIVKFMGDAGLVVFDPTRTAEAVAALRQLRSEVRDDDAGFDTDLTVKVHVGSVLTGTFGAGASRAFDVLGHAVNEAALLRGPGLVLSRAAAERLDAAARAAFEVDGEVFREA